MNRSPNPTSPQKALAESLMKTLKTLVLLGAGLIAACSKREAPYESHFPDEIFIAFPSGHSEAEVPPMQRHIDEKLRASKTGFFSGVMMGDRAIDFISIDTDFDLVDEHSVVAGFIQDGTIPKDVKVEYRRRTEDHDVLDGKTR
jgi:hypothetical protein